MANRGFKHLGGANSKEWYRKAGGDARVLEPKQYANTRVRLLIKTDQDFAVFTSIFPFDAKPDDKDARVTKRIACNGIDHNDGMKLKLIVIPASLADTIADELAEGRKGGLTKSLYRLRKKGEGKSTRYTMSLVEERSPITDKEQKQIDKYLFDLDDLFPDEDEEPKAKGKKSTSKRDDPEEEDDEEEDDEEDEGDDEEEDDE